MTVKNLLILFLLFPIISFAQSERKNFEGLMYLANDKTIEMNQGVIDWLTANLDKIVSIGGKTTISIPVQKEFKKRMRLRWIDGYLCQYAYTGSDVTLQKPKTKYIDFDFKQKKIKEKQSNDDSDDPFKPSDAKLKEKVKDKDKKDNKKPKVIR